MLNPVSNLDVLRPGTDDLMPLVDYAFASREFPAALTGEPNLKKALAMLQEQFHCRLAGVTLGVGGVLTWGGEQSIQRPAYRVSTVDTTGAGDLFHAGALSTGFCRTGPSSASLIMPAPPPR